MNSSAILELISLTKQFENQPLPAVNQVSLTLRQGELLGLLGPSGCGKTTLLRLIAGFERPQSGSIELAGRTVCGTGTWIPPERRDVGVVFQDYALFPHLCVLDNVAFGLKSLARRGKLANPQIREEAERAIALVGLSGFEKRFPHQLSGGQQQRVALARAIAPRPSLILLDEPFSNLDVQVRLYLRQEVRDILKSVGASGVFVTHDQEEALSISDCLAVMRQGTVEQFGTPEAIYRQPASRFVAGFVTQANFLQAQREGSVWKTLLGAFPANNHASNSNLGELMIRQEELMLHPDAAGELVVRDRQFLGREYRYTLTTATGELLHARTNTCDRLDIGQTVHGKVATQHPPIFLKDS
ncbi:ABC transporter ATP-binding protein [Oscillatoria sp. CS-180]|uniref:ABC transporter ATP-binding protein n=1 Tax=Oscillatoria sp. CS-180 TaxID=3021720 RepID=UPI00232B7651|nr:ABC transporter ATP-binding protein [Oscillatoria sp. CS-180]MDB9529449.1 ABC transporter ATP-binding protein [Oscillatoria sp. CS-180]